MNPKLNFNGTSPVSPGHIFLFHPCFSGFFFCQSLFFLKGLLGSQSRLAFDVHHFFVGANSGSPRIHSDLVFKTRVPRHKWLKHNWMLPSVGPHKPGPRGRGNNFTTLKIGGKTTQIIHFHRVFPYKPSILGYHYFWKHPFGKRNHFPQKDSKCKWFWFELNLLRSSLSLLLIVISNLVC